MANRPLGSASASVGSTGPRFEAGSITDTVSEQSFSIEFDVGSNNIRRDSLQTLFRIAESVGITNLRVRIDGHTDLTGTPEGNMALSRSRAET